MGDDEETVDIRVVELQERQRETRGDVRTLGRELHEMGKRVGALESHGAHALWWGVVSLVAALISLVAIAFGGHQ